jgi:hypothetical protein
VEEIASLVNESIREYEAMKDVDRALKQFGYPKEVISFNGHWLVLTYKQLDDVSLEGSSVLAEGWLAKVTRRGPAVRRFIVVQIPKAPNGGAIYYARAALSAVPSRSSVRFNLTGVQRLAVGAYFAQEMPPESSKSGYGTHVRPVVTLYRGSIRVQTVRQGQVICLHCNL